MGVAQRPQAGRNSLNCLLVAGRPLKKAVGRQQGASATQFRHLISAGSGVAGTALRSFRPTKSVFQQAASGVTTLDLLVTFQVFRALPFLGARVVVFTVTRSVSEAEEPSRRDFLAHASGYCAPRNGRAVFREVSLLLNSESQAGRCTILCQTSSDRLYARVSSRSLNDKGGQARVIHEFQTNDLKLLQPLV